MRSVLLAAAVALTSAGVAHANPADDACRAVATQQLQAGVPQQTVSANLIACQSGGSPNSGGAYVPGKAGPGPQAPPPDQVAGAGPPQGNLNDSLFPPGANQGPPRPGPQPVIPQLPDQPNNVPYNRPGGTPLAPVG
jgi:hypothetical protein